MSQPAIEEGIRLRVRGLPEGEHPISLTVPASVLGLPAYRRDIALNGTLTKEGEQLRLKLKASAVGDFECSRCTANFTREISADLDLQFLPPDLMRPDEDSEDVHEYDAFVSPTIDITQDVRDALGIAIPMRLLCQEACKGICPTCGKNLNEGPCGCEAPEIETPWSALKSLQERLRAEEKNRGSGKSET